MKFNILNFFWRRLRRKLLMLSMLALVVTFIEGVGLISLTPLVNLLIETAPSKDTVSPSQVILNIFGLKQTIVNVSFLIFVLFTIKGLSNYIFLRYTAKLKSELALGIRLKLTNYYLNQSYKSYLQTSSGEFNNLITEQVARVLRAFEFTARFISGIIASVILFTFGLILAPKLFIITVIIFSIVGIIYIRLIGATKLLSLRLTNESKDLAQAAFRVSDGFKYLKSTDKLSFGRSVLERPIANIANLEFLTGKFAATGLAIKDPISITTLLLLIFFQLTFFQEETAVFIVCLFIMHRLVGTALQLSSSYQLLSEFSGSISKIQSFDDLNVRTCKPASIESATDTTFQGDIIFDKITYGHLNGPPLLKDVTLKFPFASKTLIRGPSGSGKSTIFDLLTGLIMPQKGEVWLNHKTLAEYDMISWRRQLGVVLQDTFVFDGSLKFNITLKKDDDLTNEECKRLLLILNHLGMTDFVRNLQYGIDTQLSDKGLTLSGGQRQRIALARELFKKSPYLLLDEATSALDPENQERVWKTLTQLDYQCTIIVISHNQITNDIEFDNIIEMADIAR
jgi:ABC-type bacteriocin/lantibiotic exporter with double-glycine peptidase domain